MYLPGCVIRLEGYCLWLGEIALVRLFSIESIYDYAGKSTIITNMKYLNIVSDVIFEVLRDVKRFISNACRLWRES